MSKQIKRASRPAVREREAKTTDSESDDSDEIAKQLKRKDRDDERHADLKKKREAGRFIERELVQQEEKNIKALKKLAESRNAYPVTSDISLSFY